MLISNSFTSKTLICFKITYLFNQGF